MDQNLKRGILLFIAIDVLLAIGLLYISEVKSHDQQIPIMQIPLNPEEAILSPGPKEVTSVELTKSQRLKTGRSVKSILFSPDLHYLYSLNLEGGSVYEFDQQSKKINRKLIFKQTQAKGYDYKKHKWVNNSFAEKPVEGYFTHDGKYLWISLHNAEGIVVWNVQGKQQVKGKAFKTATIESGKKKTKVNLRFFKTGKTPKVITATKDNRYLFVSNWHSNTISVIDIHDSIPSKWKKLKDIKAGPVPRGMCVSENDSLLYVGLMGSDFLYTIGLDSLKIHKKQTVGHNPRHLLSSNQLIYMSLSQTEKLIKLQQDTFTPLKQVTTKDDPRTIALSPDGSLIFVACYSANQIQVFDTKNLKLLKTVTSKGKPVGLAVYQKGNRVETWVGNYTASSLNVFSFKLDYQKDKTKLEEVATTNK